MMQTNPAGTPYTYYAFISYKRADAKWASWLQRKLQAYRLPSRLCRKYQELPKRLTPVFLDKENLTSGHLEGSLLAELKASKYLIVICSRHSLVDPYYVNQEIRMFLEAGHTPEQIIPFIVDDCPHPEQECFPPYLQELSRENAILGVNIHDSGRHSAFLKVVAYMHQLKLTEVESAEDRRHRRNRCIAALCVLVMGAALAFTGYSLWDYHVPKVAYYLDYTTKWGLPVGIHPLTEEEIAGTASHYKLITLGKRRYELRHENAFGSLVDQGCMEYQDRPVHAVYEAPVDGRLDKVTYYSRAGKPVMVMDYSDDLKTIDLQASGTEFTTSIFLNADTTSLAASAWSRADVFGTSPGRSAITRYLVNYDDDGYVDMMRYADHNNKAMADASGVYGLRYQRDEKGRAVTVHYLTHDAAVSSAVDQASYTARSTGVCGKRYEYTALDQLGKTTYFDAAQQPCFNDYGWASFVQHYGDAHSPYALVRLDFLDPAGALMLLNEEGYAAVAMASNEQGLRTERTYLDAQLQPVNTASGVARETFGYDENGYLNQLHSFDAAGQPVANDVLMYSCIIVNDEHGNLIKTTALDAEGNPTSSNGYAVLACVRDEWGNILAHWAEDEQGMPAPVSGEAYRVQYEYDPVTGLKVQKACLGQDGQPAIGEDGYAICRYTYDDHGNCIREDYLDAHAAPVMLPQGYASQTYTYDSCGRVLENAFLDEHGQPCQQVGGYALVRREYDALGHETLTAYCGTDGNLVMADAGYALCLFTTQEDGTILSQLYDERQLLFGEVMFDGAGRRIGQTICSGYDAQGQLIVSEKGYAFCTMTYDTQGRETGMYFRNAQGELVDCTSGYARMVIEYAGEHRARMAYYTKDGLVRTEIFYDEAGRESLVRQNNGYDAQGRLLENSQGYAVAEIHYEQGVRRRMCYYNGQGHLFSENRYDEQGVRRQILMYPAHDENGNLILCEKGFACWLREVDAQGNITRSAYYDPEGNLIVSMYGYALYDQTFQDGVLSSQVYYDAQMHLIATAHFDARGVQVAMDYYFAWDEAGQPIPTEDGVAFVRRTFAQDGSVLTETYHDREGQEIPAPAPQE